MSLIVNGVNLQILVGVMVDGDTEGSRASPSGGMVMNIVKFGNNKRGMDAKELVELISDKVPSHIQISLLKDTYPQGVVRGDQFTIGSLGGEAGKSLKIDIKVLLNTLKDREKEFIVLHFGLEGKEPLCLEEISKKIVYA